MKGYVQVGMWGMSFEWIAADPDECEGVRRELGSRRTNTLMLVRSTANGQGLMT
jgi:hypothetical protein